MLTAGKLEELLVTTLMRRAGGTRRQWRAAVGSVRLLDRVTHPHCSWSVTPGGTPREIAEVERLLDTVRLEHPHVLPN